MNLPNLPQKFSGGETLTAAKLNALVDWMRDVARLLPQLQVSAGPGLSYSRGAAGTTLSLARGFLQGQGGGDSSAAGGGAGAYDRVLFNWTAAQAEGDSEGENPTGRIAVSAGLVLVRPNSASGAAARSPSVIVSPAEGLGRASVRIPKYAAAFLPEFSSEFSVLTAAELSDSSEPAVQTEISVEVSVPGYALSSTGSKTVLTGVSTGSRSASLSIPAQEAASSSEYLQSAVLSLKYEELTAQPGGAEHWTRSVVTREAGAQTVQTEKSRVTVSIPQQTVSATVSGVVTGASSTSVPAGYRLEETGAASTKTAKVAVAIPEKILDTTAEAFRPLAGGSVELSKEGEETLALDIEGAGEIGSAKLGAEEPVCDTDEDGNARPNESGFGDSGDKPQLCRVEGAEFAWGGGEKIIFLDVTGSAGGLVSFAWRMDSLDAAVGSTEYFSDAAQTVFLAVRAEIAAASAPAAAADGEDGSADGSAQAFRVRAEIADVGAFSEWRVSVPMAYVCAGTGGAPHVEPLTWGCVEVAPPVRIVLNDGWQTETAAPGNGGGGNAEAAAALAEAADYALATAEKDAYGLENRDFDFH